MPLTAMHRNDEHPAWVATVTVNGTTIDYSTGYTFTVLLLNGATTALTKTSGITGAAAGVVTTEWAVGEFDLAPATYRVLLIIRRSSDGKEHTVQDSVQVVARG